ncbi:MAG TPA: hypothetical protein VGF03_10820 [Bryobacteraceae bacterium]|jgi:hypothetical protein
MRPLTFSWNDGVVIAAVVLACGLAAFIGMPVLRQFEHDVFFSLDNAYRISQGQIPHRDFASAFGPLFFLIEAAGLTISGMRPAGIGYANALFGALIAIWTYLAVRTRLAPVPAGALGVYAVLLITAPFSLGYNPLAFSYAMGYNRYGYALLGIILVECGVQALRTDAHERQGSGRAFSIGVAWALLAFLKISYAMVAVPFLIVWLWCGADRGRRSVALCGGFGVVAAILLCYLRFDFTDMFRDLAEAASARRLTWQPRSILSPAVVIESIPLLLLAAVLTAGTGEAPWRRVRLWLFVLLTVGVGGFLLSTNHQSMSLPLGGFAAVVLVDAAIARRDSGGGADRPRRLLALFLAALCFLPLAMMNAVSLAAASWERYRGPEAAAVRLNSERGASMIFGPVESSMTSETGGPAYVEVLNDGLELIRTRAEPGVGVMTIDVLNPFNYLLSRPSPRGGMATAVYHLTFSDAAHPSAERFFGDARYVLVRKYSQAVQDFPIEDYLIQGLLRTYQPALEQRFRLVEETGHWSLWRRK